MLKVEYRFRLETDTSTEEVFPIYGADMSKEYVRESGQAFFREKLTGVFTFLRGDYDLIKSSDFEHEFILHVDRVPRGEAIENDWFKGTFTITDCDVDEDNKKIEVQPLPLDRYKKIIDGLEKEFDLIEASPETVEVDLKIQPVVQVYLMGSNVVTNIMSGVHWEQPVQQPINNDSELTNTYFFNNSINQIYIPGTSANGGTLNPDVSGDWNYPQYDSANNRYQLVTVGFVNPVGSTPTDDPAGDALSMFVITSSTLDDYDDFLSVWQATNGNQFEYIGSQAVSGVLQYHFRGLTANAAPSTGTLIHVSGGTNTGDQIYTDYQNNQFFFRWGIYDQNPPTPFIQQFVYLATYFFETLEAAHFFQQGKLRSLIDPNSECRFFTAVYYVRFLTNDLTVGGNPTNAIPANDLVTSHSRHTRVIGLSHTEFLGFDGNSVTADRFGKFAFDSANFANQYFPQPETPVGGVGQTYPLAKSEWSEVSWWFYYDAALETLQEDGGTAYVLRNAYRLGSSIQSIINLIDPTITHLEDLDHSEFLYGTNIIRGDFKTPLIAPKSNILVSAYDKPATRSKVRLSDFLNFISDFYNAGWFIDESNRLRVEHIQYFENGGTYAGTNIGSDLTTLIEPKTKKLWSYRSKKYKFDKIEMPERISHSWMDESTEAFNGFSIEINSAYVQKGNLDERSMSKFTADVDLIHTNGDQISNDGFAFMEAVLTDGRFSLPIVTITISANLIYKVQNGYAAMTFAHDQYWRYQLPASNVNMNLQNITALSVMKNKIQEIDFPSIEDVDPMQLIKTSLGDGRVSKLSINLSSKAIKTTLKHGTE